MGAFEKLREKFLTMTEDGTFNSLNDMAVTTGIEQKSLRAFLKEKKGLSLKNAAKALDYLQASIVFQDEKKVESTDQTRPVKFVNARKVPGTAGLPDPEVDNYRAVPLVSTVAAGKGRVAEEELRSWVLVYDNEVSIRGRSRLMAVRIGEGEKSMEPLLHPGDIVIIDMDDTRVDDGSIYLVRYPGTEEGAIKRVRITTETKTPQVLFFSENTREFTPNTYDLESDYPDPERGPVVGRAVWHWSDIRYK